MNIVAIDAYQIYDSRGNPTVEAVVTLTGGAYGLGTVPSGASTGQFEALELRDGDPARLRGKSVYRAIDNIRTRIAPALVGRSAADQRAVDQAMLELDGTPNKAALGANAVLAVSMAVANARAAAEGVPLFHSLGDGQGTLLPLPQIQIVGGGAHANWRTDVQDWLLVPIGAATYAETLEITHNVYHAAGDLLKADGRYYGVADEGGFWPEFTSNEAVFDFFLTAMEHAGYRPGVDVAMAVDVAASDLFDGTRYRLALDDRSYTPAEFADLIAGWCARYPIVSLEDPMADSDWDGWTLIRAQVGDKLQLIGDDLFTTNPARIRDGIARDVANAVLVKLNQIGTVTETLDAIALTQEAGWRPVISARSGETEDAFITHLAVATNAGQLKVGSFTRSERMVKWNEALRIERALGDQARFVGAQILPRATSG